MLDCSLFTTFTSGGPCQRLARPEPTPIGARDSEVLAKLAKGSDGSCVRRIRNIENSVFELHC